MIRLQWFLSSGFRITFSCQSSQWCDIIEPCRLCFSSCSCARQVPWILSFLKISPFLIVCTKYASFHVFTRSVCVHEKVLRFFCTWRTVCSISIAFALRPHNMLSVGCVCVCVCVFSCFSVYNTSAVQLAGRPVCCVNLLQIVAWWAEGVVVERPGGGLQ